MFEARLHATTSSSTSISNGSLPGKHAMEISIIVDSMICHFDFEARPPNKPPNAVIGALYASMNVAQTIDPENVDFGLFLEPSR